MKKRLILILLGSFIFFYARSQDKPNIVFILIDDLGPGWIPPYADKLEVNDLEEVIIEAYSSRKGFDARKHIETARKSMPFVASLASDGAVFNRCFTTSSLCAPSRSAIVTGKYQEQWGSYTIPDVEQAGIPKRIKSLPKEFQQNGYRTALIGKWHVSPKDLSLRKDKNISAAHFRSSSEKGRGPLDMGFDYYYGYNDSHSTYYKASNLWENTSPVPPLGEKEFLTDVLSDKAISFVKQSLSNKKPFFLYYAPMTLHGGIVTPPEKYVKKFNSGVKFTDDYAAHLLALDEGIKRLYATLSEFKQDNNTIFILCSDNGSPYIVLPYNAPYKGGKGTGWLGGSASPLIITWPGKIKAQRVNANVSTMDILPTALDMAGLKVPAGLDAVSLKEVTLSGNQDLKNRIIYSSGLHSSRWSYSYYNREAKKIMDSNECPFYVWGIQDNNVILSLTAVKPGLYDKLKAGLSPQNYFFNLDQDISQDKPIQEDSKARRTLADKTRQWPQNNLPPLTTHKEEYQSLIKRFNNTVVYPDEMRTSI